MGVPEYVGQGPQVRSRSGVPEHMGRGPCPPASGEPLEALTVGLSEGTPFKNFLACKLRVEMFAFSSFITHCFILQDFEKGLVAARE